MRLYALVCAQVVWQSLIPQLKAHAMTSPLLWPTLTITIQANVDPIDGVGGILGSAGPTIILSPAIFDDTIGGGHTTLPFTGEMTFDSADVASLEAGGIFGAFHPLSIFFTNYHHSALSKLSLLAYSPPHPPSPPPSPTRPARQPQQTQPLLRL
jgi:hypothetical protein